MKRTRVTALLLFFVDLLSCSRLYGQAGSGDISGEVRDASGGLVAGAQVTLTNLFETCPGSGQGAGAGVKG